MERTTMKPKEVAAYLGISNWMLYEEVKKRNIPHFRVGKRILFKRESIDEYIAALEKNFTNKNSL